MNTAFTLHLGAPTHAVEPALLAQRLSNLAAALQRFCSAAGVVTATTAQPAGVQVFAGQLGVQRDHVTLDALPLLSAEHHAPLVAIAASLAADFAAENLVFSASSHCATLNCLGTFNLQLALPAAAQFIGRDIAKALPRSPQASVLRQFVNAAQMTLHQAPLAGCAVNSLWCGPALPTDALSHTWLQGGLTAWWDALPAWDAQLNVSQLSAASELAIVRSDAVLRVPLKRRTAWALWAKPLNLSTLLEA